MPFYARLMALWMEHPRGKKAFGKEAAQRFRLRTEELDEMGVNDYRMLQKFRLTSDDAEIVWRDIKDFLNTEIFSKEEMDSFTDALCLRAGKREERKESKYEPRQFVAAVTREKALAARTRWRKKNPDKERAYQRAYKKKSRWKHDTENQIQRTAGKSPRAACGETATGACGRQH